MGRKTQITREMILEAAYELLDESGIGAVGIKQIAEKDGEAAPAADAASAEAPAEA